MSSLSEVQTINKILFFVKSFYLILFLFAGNANAGVYGPGTSSGSYTISWDAVAAGGNNSSILSYTVAEVFGGTTTNHLVSEATTSRAFTKTVNGVYQYTVSYTKETCNPRTYECYVVTSAIGQVTVTVTLPLLPIPSVFTVPDSDSDGNYSISWSSVTGATSYILQESLNNGGWNTIQSSNALTMTVSNRPNGNHGYRVQACGSNNCSGFTTEKYVTVLRPPGTPGAISAPSTDDDGFYTASWGAPANSLVTSYGLQEQVNNGGWSDIQNSSELSKWITGKSVGTYGYRVKACNASGCSNFSPVTTVTVSTTFTTVNGSGQSTGTYTISWNLYVPAPRETLINYTVAESFSGSTTNHALSGTSMTFTKRVNGTYQYNVSVIKEVCNPASVDCAVGTSGIGSVSVDVTLPIVGVPGVITAPDNDFDGIYSVSWGAATGATLYILQESNNGIDWVDNQTTGLTVPIFGKADGTYRYRVKGCDVSGCGVYTALAAVSVLHIPGVLGSFQVPSTDGDGTYSVSWTAPLVSIVSHYILEEKWNNGNWAAFPNMSGMSKQIIDNTNGNYSYRVKACNASGCGNFTDSKTIVVTIILEPPATINVPVNSADGNYTVSWSVGTAATYYQISEKFNTSASSGYVSVGNVLSFSYSGKVNGNYSYRVRSCKGSDCSVPITSSIITVDRTPGTQVIFIHTDLLGSPVVETDETGRAR